MSSCQDALINNIYTNLQNFDSTITFSLEKRRLKKIWLAAANSRTADLQNVTNTINAKYDSGFYIKKNYPGILPEVINSVLNTYRLANISDFYANYIVDPATRTVQGCHPYNNSIPCSNANSIEQLCTTCAHAPYEGFPQVEQGKNESCNTSTTGWRVADPNNCYIRLNVNLFQSYIDKEIADAAAIIDRNIATLYNTYNSYSQRNLLVPNDVGCCQSTQFTGISASNITFDNISNQCTIKK